MEGGCGKVKGDVTCVPENVRRIQEVYIGLQRQSILREQKKGKTLKWRKSRQKFEGDAEVRSLLKGELTKERKNTKKSFKITPLFVTKKLELNRARGKKTYRAGEVKQGKGVGGMQKTSGQETGVAMEYRWFGKTKNKLGEVKRARAGQKIGEGRIAQVYGKRSQ